MRKFIMTLLFATLVVLTVACEEEKESQKKDILTNLEWETTEGGIEITNYSGTDKVVEVPEVIEGKKVVAIDRKAFSGNVTIEQLILPESITRVDSLGGCDSLKVLKAPGAKWIGTLPESLKELYLPAYEDGFNLEVQWQLDVLDVSSAKYLQSNASNITYDAKTVVISEELRYFHEHIINEPDGRVLSEGMSLYSKQQARETSVLITEENAAEIYCEFFGNDTVVVNGVEYSK